MCFLAGTWAGLNTAVPTFAFLAVIIALSILLFLVWHLRRKSTLPDWPGTLAVCTVACSVAWLNTAIHARADSPRIISATVTGHRVKMDVIGVVADTPCMPPYVSIGPSSWRFPLDVRGFRMPGESAWQPASGQVYVSWYASPKTKPPEYGQEWLLSGRISQPGESGRSPSGRRTTIFFSTSSRKSELVSSGHGNRLVKWCLSQRAIASSLISEGIDDFPEQVGILNSLLLGYRSQMSRDAYQDFARTGTLHIFAISGSHVVVLAAIIIFVLGIFKIPRTLWILILAPLLVYYTVMTGLQASAVRACIMAIVFWLAPLIGRKSDIHASVAVAAILILFFSPDSLYDVGCVLSFLAVIGLVLLYPVVYRPFATCFRPDPLRLQPEHPVVQVARRVWKESGLLVATSTAAWLTTLPLTACFFGLFSPVALIGNLLVIPISSLIIATGCLSIFFGLWSSWMAGVFNHANLAMVSLLRYIMDRFERIPGGWVEVDPPPTWLVLCFYSALAALVCRFHASHNDLTDDVMSVPAPER